MSMAKLEQRTQAIEKTLSRQAGQLDRIQEMLERLVSGGGNSTKHNTEFGSSGPPGGRPRGPSNGSGGGGSVSFGGAALAATAAHRGARLQSHTSSAGGMSSGLVHGSPRKRAVSVANPTMPHDEFNAKTVAAAYHLTPERIDELLGVFRSFDTDSDGMISRDELRELIDTQTGGASSEKMVDAFMDEFDVDQSGSLGFDELILLVGSFREKAETLKLQRVQRLANAAGMSLQEYAEVKADVVHGIMTATHHVFTDADEFEETLAQAEGRAPLHAGPPSPSGNNELMADKHHHGGMDHHASFRALTLKMQAGMSKRHIQVDEDDEDDDDDYGGRAGRRASRMKTRRRGKWYYCGRKRLMIHPHSIFHGCWDLSVSLILMITIFTMPISVAFDDIATQLFAFNFTVDMIFALDFIKAFFTGFVDLDDRVIMKWDVVAVHYLKTWALIDLVTCIPIDAILIWTQAGGDSSEVARSTKVLKLLRLLRLAKLFRLLRMSRVFRYVRFFRSTLEDHLKIRIPYEFVKMVRLGLVIFMASHILACVMFLVVRMSDYPAESWVVIHELDKADGYTQYQWALFKAAYTLINGEDMMQSGIGASSGCETLRTEWCRVESRLSLISLYAGSFLYAIIIAELAAIVANLDQASTLFQAKYSQVNEYMRAKKLPADIRDQIRDYYQIKYQDRQIFDEEGIMKELSPFLRNKILRWNQRDIFNKVPLFTNAPDQAVNNLVAHVSPMVLFPGDVIFQVATRAESMFFVYSGMVEIFLPESAVPASNKTSAGVEILAQLNSGCYFGDVALVLEHSPKRSASARVSRQGVCTLYTVNKEDVLAFFHDYPVLLSHVMAVAGKRLARVHHKRGLLAHLPEEFKIDDEDAKADESFEATAEAVEAANLMYRNVTKGHVATPNNSSSSSSKNKNMRDNETRRSSRTERGLQKVKNGLLSAIRRTSKQLSPSSLPSGSSSGSGAKRSSKTRVVSPGPGRRSGTAADGASRAAWESKEGGGGGGGGGGAGGGALHHQENPMHSQRRLHPTPQSERNADDDPELELVDRPRGEFKDGGAAAAAAAAGGGGGGGVGGGGGGGDGGLSAEHELAEFSSVTDKDVEL